VWNVLHSHSPLHCYFLSSFLPPVQHHTMTTTMAIHIPYPPNSAEEVKELNSFRDTKGDPKKCGSVSQFLLTLTEIPRIKNKIDIHLACITLDHQVSELADDIEVKSTNHAFTFTFTGHGMA
jgi:hypothetical protein